MNEIVTYPNCIVCGKQNSGGLKARFYTEGEVAWTEIVAGPPFEGYMGIFHGGITATLLDEVMVKAILAKGVYAVTAELNIRYLAPVKVGDALRVTGTITHTKGRFITAEATAHCGERLVATARGKYIQAKEELRTLLERSVTNT